MNLVYQSFEALKPIFRVERSDEKKTYFKSFSLISQKLEEILNSDWTNFVANLTLDSFVLESFLRNLNERIEKIPFCNFLIKNKFFFKIFNQRFNFVPNMMYV